jgi:hypothetical protein
MDTSSNITRREVIQNLVFATANVGLLQFVTCTSQSSDDKTFDTQKKRQIKQINWFQIWTTLALMRMVN